MAMLNMFTQLPWWGWVIVVLVLLMVAFIWDGYCYHKYQVPWESQFAKTGREYPGDRQARKELAAYNDKG